VLQVVWRAVHALAKPLMLRDLDLRASTRSPSSFPERVQSTVVQIDKSAIAQCRPHMLYERSDRGYAHDGSDDSSIPK
jgi:hypothetical protein